MKKLLLTYILFTVSSAFSAEIRLFFNGYGPSESTITTRDNDVKSERKWDSEHQYAAGTEVNFNAEFSPIRYGFGVGYRTPLKEDDTEIIPAAIPVWGNFYFGRIDADNIVSPYIIARVGALPLFTSAGCWWELPLHFFVAGGVGVILPFNIGIEVHYEYASLLKSYEYKDVEYRISTGKLGARLSIGFDISRDKIYKPHDRVEVYQQNSSEYYDDEEEFSENGAAQSANAQNAETSTENAETGAAPANSVAPVAPATAETAQNTTENSQTEEAEKQQPKSTSEKRMDSLRKKSAKTTTTKTKTSTKSKSKSSTKSNTKSKSKSTQKRSKKK
ncbi:hypothetical protein [Fibrobacter sp.]|uniref:hypothetical protein n=1 Tax=Fibrobacter sp. TaxID=35828 RepID=UPI0038903210